MWFTLLANKRADFYTELFDSTVSRPLIVPFLTSSLVEMLKSIAIQSEGRYINGFWIYFISLFQVSDWSIIPFPTSLLVEMLKSNILVVHPCNNIF